MKLEYTDDIYEILDKVYACILHREEFDSTLSLTAFRELDKVVNLEELSGEYLLIHLALKRQDMLKSYRKEFPFKITYNVLESALEVGIQDILTRSADNFTELLGDLELSSDLSIDLNMQQACSGIITYTLQKYKDLTTLEVEQSDALEYVNQLISLLKRLMCNTCTILASEILIEGAYVNKQRYVGVEGYVDFVGQIPGIIKSRFDRFLEVGKKAMSFNSMDAHHKFMEANKGTIKKLFQFGLAPLDDVLHVSTSDVVTVIGDEGVGKTNFMIMSAVQMLMTGKDVLIMAGESPIIKIYCMCLSNYIYRKHGYRLSWLEIHNPLNLSEQMQKIVLDAAFDINENPNIGNVFIVKEFYYETFKEDVRHYLERFPNIGLVCIDHIDRLGSTGELTELGFLKSQKERVDYLIRNEVDLSDDYPIAILNISHTSADANKALARGKEVGVRSGSSSGGTTKEADMVFMIRKTLDGSTDDFVKFETKKIRDFKDGIKPFLLMKDFTCCNYIYSDEYQYKDDLDDDIDEDDL